MLGDGILVGYVAFGWVYRRRYGQRVFTGMRYYSENVGKIDQYYEANDKIVHRSK